jgi:hypothetical protein
MCVIIYTKINGKQYLIKNRDRVYDPKIEIVQEIVNGVEVVYIHDLLTGWKEGMNEFGIGIVNSSISKEDDNNKSIIQKVKKNPHYLETLDKSKIKGTQNYEVFIDPLFKEKFHTFFLDKKFYPLSSGHTLLCIDQDVFHSEKYKDKKQKYFFLHKLDGNNSIVITNHGIHGKVRRIGHHFVSSFLRREITDYEMKHHPIHRVDDVLDILNTNYTNIDPRFHPYRDGIVSKKNKNGKESKYVSTTGILVYNMTDKIFDYYSDIHHTSSVNYINKLPKEYTPKIQVNIHNIEKNMNRKKVFPKLYLQTLFKKITLLSQQKTIKNKNHRKKYTRKLYTRKYRMQKK